MRALCVRARSATTMPAERAGMRSGRGTRRCVGARYLSSVICTTLTITSPTATTR